MSIAMDSLFTTLAAKYVLKLVQRLDEAESYITAHKKPDFILIPNGHICQYSPYHERFRLQVIPKYVKEGGTVIFMGHFSSDCSDADIHMIFHDSFGLPWVSGVRVADFACSLAGYMIPKGVIHGMSDGINFNGRLLANVSVDHTLYFPREWSHANTPVEEENVSLTPVAWLPLEWGRVGYVGFEAPGAQVNHIVLFMCGM